MSEDYNKWTNQFWNDKNNIFHFESQPYSDYWVEYFSSIPNKEQNKVLDLGCGGGRNSKMLYEMGFNLHACDLYSGMVETTRKVLKQVGMPESKALELVTQQSMTNLEYADKYFDLILSHGVFHNALSFEAYKKGLQECARVLKRSGKLCFNIFYKRGDVDSTLTRIESEAHYYLTEENLPTILVSKDDFLALADQTGFVALDPIYEYSSNITTGRREVLRGVLTKR